MKISDLSVGNTVITASAKVITLNTTMLGQYQLWDANNQKWQKPFDGILLTIDTLPLLGFRLAVIGKDFDCNVLDTYENVMINNDKCIIAFDVYVTNWYIVTISDDKNKLLPESKGLIYVHELQNACRWIDYEVPVYDGAI